MKVLIWQWGRCGAGPRFAACLAEALRGEPGVSVVSSFSRYAEILSGPAAPPCELPVVTYRGHVSFLLRFITAPLAVPLLMRRLWPIRPDVAVCAMPGPLDIIMAVALRLLGVKLFVIVHQATSHAGDGFPIQIPLQRLLFRCADSLVTLSQHVEEEVRALQAGAHFISLRHPPFAFDLPVAPRAPGPPRLLFFGRLLPYKGLDLLAAALRLLPPDSRMEIRIAGLGPESEHLAQLRSLPNVTVENRWVSETDIGPLLGWADALVLPYREASQSGVAAAAIAANRTVIATRVGGLPEQLEGSPLAVLCDPSAAGLAVAVRQWLSDPPPAYQPTDVAKAWRATATTLARAIRNRLAPAIGHGRSLSWVGVKRQIAVPRADRVRDRW